MQIPISVEMVMPFRYTKKFCILQWPISYCVILIMVTIMRQVFINIFQMEHYSAVRFDMGSEKNMTSLVIPKSPNVWKNVEKIGLGSFNMVFVHFCKMHWEI